MERCFNCDSVLVNNKCQKCNLEKTSESTWKCRDCGEEKASLWFNAEGCGCNQEDEE